jgi:hypothetical protein
MLVSIYTVRLCSVSNESCKDELVNYSFRGVFFHTLSSRCYHTHSSSPACSWDVVSESVHMPTFTFSTQRLESQICEFVIIVYRVTVPYRLCLYNANESWLYLGCTYFQSRSHYTETQWSVIPPFKLATLYTTWAEGQYYTCCDWSDSVYWYLGGLLRKEEFYSYVNCAVGYVFIIRMVTLLLLLLLFII